MSFSFSSAPISFKTERTVSYSKKIFLSEESRTRIKRSAFSACDRVLLNASIKVCGSRLIKPTVSVKRMELPSFNFNFRVSGSKVAKSLSSTKESEPVSAFKRLDFPAFV